MSSLSLLETDYKCDDYGRDSGYCKHCSKNAFDKSNDEEMLEMSSKEYPVWVKKKFRERTVENYRHQRQKIMANALVDGDVSSFLLALKKESNLQTTTQSSHF